MAMSTLTAEAIPPAIETVLLRQDVSGANIALCMLLGVERSNVALFEGHLAVLLRQVQVAAFAASVSLPEFLLTVQSPLLSYVLLPSSRSSSDGVYAMPPARDTSSWSISLL